MTYTKPEIAVLGDAAPMIRELGKGVDVVMDPSTGDRDFHPAYDLDE
ncbi:MAG: hypothetical protein L0387_33520 [Acidobacteria bacterium]|nr:hypothetical protein [Acidobacteriota bacterium]MCI0721938.1 hypothetical protein [Acidobacteriota bacterium]